MDAVAIGEVLVDFTMQGVNQVGFPVLDGNSGGAPANFLAAMAKFGAKTKMLAKVGADVFGKKLIETIAACNIDTSGMIEDEDCFTTLAFVTLDENGDREFSFARKPGADTRLTLREVDPACIDKTKVVYFGATSLTQEPMRSTLRQIIGYAKQQKKTIVFDPNYRPPLWESADKAKEEILWGLSQASIVKMSIEEAEFIFGAGPKECAEILLRDFDIKLAFITCGKEGCFYHTAKHSGYVPALQDVAVKDTTGAGDIFTGSAVFKLLQTQKQPQDCTQQQLEEIVRFACVSAGLSTTRQGGLLSVFTQQEIVQAMQTQSLC